MHTTQIHHHTATDCNRLQQTATDCNRLKQTEYLIIPDAHHKHTQQHSAIQSKHAPNTFSSVHILNSKYPWLKTFSQSHTHQTHSEVRTSSTPNILVSKHSHNEIRTKHILKCALPHLHTSVAKNILIKHPHNHIHTKHILKCALPQPHTSSAENILIMTYTLNTLCSVHFLNLIHPRLKTCSSSHRH